MAENQNIWHLVEIDVEDMRRGNINLGQFKGNLSSRTSEPPRIKNAAVREHVDCTMGRRGKQISEASLKTLGKTGLQLPGTNSLKFFLQFCSAVFPLALPRKPRSHPGPDLGGPMQQECIGSGVGQTGFKSYFTAYACCGFS